ncbi:MAG: hypothetical protein J6X55_09830 [Victivallales bacterium]|nr:hypothetical protein [Victivallales bacterium]
MAMNLVAIMIAEDLAEEFGKPAEEVLLDFMQSRTAKKLYNDKLKLWWDRPSSVGEEYKQELAENGSLFLRGKT